MLMRMQLSAAKPTSSLQVLVWVVFVAWVVAQLVYVLLPRNLEPVGNFFIVFLFVVFSALHMVLLRGVRPMLLLLLLCFLLAGGLEVLSVQTGFPFGRYRYSQDFGPAVFGVSVLVPSCWFMMAYPVLCLTELCLTELRMPKMFFVPVAALALTAWDLFLDPQMVRFGHWVWLEPQFYAGVPLVNYAGWLLTASIVFFVFQKCSPGGVVNFSVFGLLPVFAYIWTWFGLALVNLVWWQVPVVALVGGVGMAVFAVPALFVLQKKFGGA